VSCGVITVPIDENNEIDRNELNRKDMDMR
jgi:hypothetical protein